MLRANESLVFEQRVTGQFICSLKKCLSDTNGLQIAEVGKSCNHRDCLCSRMMSVQSFYFDRPHFLNRQIRDTFFILIGSIDLMVPPAAVCRAVRYVLFTAQKLGQSVVKAAHLFNEVITKK